MERERADEVRAHLETILQSPQFARKPKLPILLRYVVNRTLAGEGGELKEYAIAIDVFGKPASFKGGTDDAIVRSNMNKLRKELALYYQRDGKEDRVRVHLEPHRYAPSFQFLDSAHATTATPIKERGRFIAVITAEFESFQDFLSLEPGLKALSGDPTLRVLQLRVGSLCIVFECSRDGFDALSRHVEDGTLRQIGGHPIESLRREGDTNAELQEHRVHVLQNCSTPLIPLKVGQPWDITVTVRRHDETGSAKSHNEIVVEAQIFTSPGSKTWSLARRFHTSDVAAPKPETVRSDVLADQYLRAEFRVAQQGISGTEGSYIVSIERIDARGNTILVALRTQRVTTAARIRQLVLEAATDPWLKIDRLARELAEKDPRAARVLELRLFGGYTASETAAILNEKQSRVRHEWQFVLSWLRRRIEASAPLSDWLSCPMDVPMPWRSSVATEGLRAN